MFNPTKLSMRLLPYRISVCRLDSSAAIPTWCLDSRIFSITRTPSELSIVCEERLVVVGDIVKEEQGWRPLAIEGPLSFDMTGVIASVSTLLASSQISIFAISTFDTDLILVRDSTVSMAVETLRQSGLFGIEIDNIGESNLYARSQLVHERPAEPRPRILRSNHTQVSIPIGSEQKARDFYCGLLGMTEVSKPEELEGRGGFWLQLETTLIHFGAEDGVDRRISKAHVSYEVNDLYEWRVKLEANGIVCVPGLKITGWDRFDIRDPFGNRIELMQRVLPSRL